MRYLLAMVLSVILMSNLCLAEEKLNLKHEKAKVNYSVGYQIGDDFKRQGVEINPEALVKGIRDAISEKTPLMTAEEQRATLVNLQRKVAAQQEQDDATRVQE